MALRKFIIERDIPKVGTFEREQLRAAAAKSNEVLHQLGPDIQWVESYVADNKTFCVYLAKDEAIIRKHAEVSGFPATKITEVKKMIDPTTSAPRNSRRFGATRKRSVAGSARRLAASSLVFPVAPLRERVDGRKRSRSCCAAQSYLLQRTSYFVWTRSSHRAGAGTLSARTRFGRV